MVGFTYETLTGLYLTPAEAVKIRLYLDWSTYMLKKLNLDAPRAETTTLPDITSFEQAVRAVENISYIIRCGFTGEAASPLDSVNNGRMPAREIQYAQTAIGSAICISEIRRGMMTPWLTTHQIVHLCKVLDTRLPVRGIHGGVAMTPDPTVIDTHIRPIFELFLERKIPTDQPEALTSMWSGFPWGRLARQLIVRIKDMTSHHAERDRFITAVAAMFPRRAKQTERYLRSMV